MNKKTNKVVFLIFTKLQHETTRRRVCESENDVTMTQDKQIDYLKRGCANQLSLFEPVGFDDVVLELVQNHAIAHLATTGVSVEIGRAHLNLLVDRATFLDLLGYNSRKFFSFKCGPFECDQKFKKQNCSKLSRHADSWDARVGTANSV